MGTKPSSSRLSRDCSDDVVAYPHRAATACSLSRPQEVPSSLSNPMKNAAGHLRLRACESTRRRSERRSPA